jgi:predicted Zn-dependent protease
MILKKVKTIRKIIIEMKTQIKYTLLTVAYLICVNLLPAQDNAIISAIKTEVERNKSELKIDKLRPPFFINYTIVDVKQTYISATLGSIERSVETAQRAGLPYLLVGDYDRNNSNFHQNDSPRNVTVETDARGIATAVWDDLDKTYKNAAENYEAKVAAIAQQNMEEEELNLPDLEKTKPVTMIIKPQKLNTAKNYWENFAKKSSELLKKYPEILNSSVTVDIRDHAIYVYNTENTSLVISDPYYGINLSLYTVTDDGQELSDILSIEHRNIEQMPSLQAFIDTCESFVKYFIDLKNAPIITEAYTGPVLFEGMAVAESFQTYFFQSTLLANRKPVGGWGGNNTEMMKDKKIISRNLTIKSLSGTATYKGIKLDGYYPVDVEGVVPDKELILVENGVLKNMLNGRTPTKKFRHSNGHQHMNLNTMSPRISPGNVLFTSNDSYSSDDLKKKLLAAAKEEDLDYAYIVRRYRGNAPLSIYRIYVADGREELLRGAILPDFNIRSYKRTLGTSNRELIYNTYTFGHFATYIVPEAFLFEELEVSRNNNITLKKPFIVPQPTE